MRLPCFPISIDAFHGSEGTHAFFLSHLHTDHMAGLSATWCRGSLYTSAATRGLLAERFGQEFVNAKPIGFRSALCGAGSGCVIALPLSVPVSVPLRGGPALPGPSRSPDYVTVVALPVQHIPGSVMFLFPDTPLGSILYTGDFKFVADSTAGAGLLDIIRTFLPAPRTTVAAVSSVAEGARREAPMVVPHDAAVRADPATQGETPHGELNDELCDEWLLEALRDEPCEATLSHRRDTDAEVQVADPDNADGMRADSPPPEGGLTKRPRSPASDPGSFSPTRRFESDPTAAPPEGTECGEGEDSRGLDLLYLDDTWLHLALDSSGNSFDRLTSKLLTDRQLAAAFESITRLTLGAAAEAIERPVGASPRVGGALPRRYDRRPVVLRCYIHNNFGKEALLGALARRMGTTVLLDDQRYRLLAAAAGAEDEGGLGAFDEVIDLRLFTPASRLGADTQAYLAQTADSSSVPNPLLSSNNSCRTRSCSRLPPGCIEIVSRRCDIDPNTLLAADALAAQQQQACPLVDEHVSVAGPPLEGETLRVVAPLHFALVMTGWARLRGRHGQHPRVLHVPYSLHSAPQDLMAFVAALRPRCVLPLTPRSGRAGLVMARLGPYLRVPFFNECLIPPVNPREGPREGPHAPPTEGRRLAALGAQALNSGRIRVAIDADNGDDNDQPPATWESALPPYALSQISELFAESGPPL